MRVNFRRLRKPTPPSGPVVLFSAPSSLSSQRWYKHVYITDLSESFACDQSLLVTVRGLHLGHPKSTPESLIRLHRADVGSPWCVVPHEVLKAYAPFTLLCLAWLGCGNGFAPRTRACLVGVAGGSLAHLWSRCVPGGDTMDLDAVELDGAVLEAARAHLGLREVEESGRVTCHEGEGCAFIRACGDAVYDLVMLDLDFSLLLSSGGHHAGVHGDGWKETHGDEWKERAEANSSEVDAPCARGGNGSLLPHLWRALTAHGVLMINEFDDGDEEEEEEEGRSWHRVRRGVELLLDAGFPEVHAVRTTPRNHLLIAPRLACADSGVDASQLVPRTLASAKHVQLNLDLVDVLGRLRPGTDTMLFSGSHM